MRRTGGTLAGEGGAAFVLRREPDGPADGAVLAVRAAFCPAGQSRPAALSALVRATLAEAGVDGADVTTVACGRRGDARDDAEVWSAVDDGLGGRSPAERLHVDDVVGDCQAATGAWNWPRCSPGTAPTRPRRRVLAARGADAGGRRRRRGGPGPAGDDPTATAGLTADDRDATAAAATARSRCSCTAWRTTAGAGPRSPAASDRSGGRWRCACPGTPATTTPGGTPGGREWVAAGLSKLPAPPTVLVGHSFGANAILELLATSPQPPARTAVLTTPFYRPHDAPVTWRAFDRSRRIFQRQISDGLRSRLTARKTSLEPDIPESMLERAWERTGPSAFLAVFEQYLASGHLPVQTVEIPVLVVGGERDPGLNRDHLRALTDRLPLGLLAREPDYDHFCHRRHAHRLGRSIDRFARYGTDAERPAR
ncbi:alpha/beta hydrolase [Micromonospora sp. BRA006-A]|nr:alpha/beta hydrolase [Micromonospora sp. BRA006-A]